jgi:hypothetical protein
VPLNGGQHPEGEPGRGFGTAGQAGCRAAEVGGTESDNETEGN